MSAGGSALAAEDGRVAWRQTATSRPDWFGRSGFSGDADAIAAPERYARRLARYIRDDSRVVALVADRFGRRGLVTREQVCAIRAALAAERAQRDAAMSVPEPGHYDGYDFVAWERSFRARDMHVAQRAARQRDVHEQRGLFLRECRMDRSAGWTGTRRGRKPGPVGPGDPRGLIAAAEAASGVAAGCVRGRGQTRDLIDARSLAAVLLKASGNSWVQTGALIGGRDHTTAINLGKVFFARTIKDPRMMQAWQRLAPCVTGAARTYDEFRAIVARPA